MSSTTERIDFHEVERLKKRYMAETQPFVDELVKIAQFKSIKKITFNTITGEFTIDSGEDSTHEKWLKDQIKIINLRYKIYNGTEEG